MKKEDFPSWTQYLFRNCRQEFPHERYLVAFLGPSYTDATRGPTSLRDALECKQQSASTYLIEVEKVHEVEVSHRGSMYGSGFLCEMHLWYGETKHVADQMSLEFYTEELEEMEEVLTFLGIDIKTLWAGDNSYEP